MNDILEDVNTNVEEQNKKILEVHWIGVLATTFIGLYMLLSYFVGIVSVGLIPLAISFILCVLGFVKLTYIKRENYQLTAQNSKMLKVAKILLWVSFAIFCLFVLSFVAFIIYIGMYGFGR